MDGRGHSCNSRCDIQHAACEFAPGGLRDLSPSATPAGPLVYSRVMDPAPAPSSQDPEAGLHRPGYEFVHRTLDLVLSVPLAIVLAPLMVLLWVAIRLDSPGAPIFRQERVGRGGRRFTILKFRSMTAGIPQEGKHLFVKEGDARITRMGRILRSTSLDELPQLLNVLAGQMSVVGPRPPVPWWPHEYDDYPPVAKTRFLVRPGITGYSQVVGRNDVTWDERLEHDAWYVRHRSVRLYLWILWRTLFRVASREGVARKAAPAPAHASDEEQA